MAIYTILKTSSSIFGKITIGETLGSSVRWMKINNEIEGQVFLDDNGIPGAIAASRYLYAFIIPAWHFPTSHGLMLGLGAGIGATMLLTLFPDLHLSVVEIDPEIIRLARSYFPLIALYEKQQRLTIIQADARDYIKTTKNSFSFVLLDIFSGDENGQYNFDLLDDIQAIAPYFMANIISSDSLLPEISKERMWLRAFSTNATEETNWLLTNMKSISPAIQGYRLFDAHTPMSANVATANKIFKYILSQIDAACFYR